MLMYRHCAQSGTFTLSNSISHIPHQQAARKGKKVLGDKAKGGGAGRVPGLGRVNGHHQENGMENMTLFEMVKLGKSATQVGTHSLDRDIISCFVFSFCNGHVTCFSLLLMTGSRRTNMTGTWPSWT